MRDIVDYESRASWWICKISSPWGQRLVAKYLAWKVNRKWERYQKSLWNKLDVELVLEARKRTGRITQTDGSWK